MTRQRIDLDKPLGPLNDPRRDPRLGPPVSLRDVTARNNARARSLRQEMTRKLVNVELAYGIAAAVGDPRQVVPAFRALSRRP